MLRSDFIECGLRHFASASCCSRCLVTALLSAIFSEKQVKQQALVYHMQKLKDNGKVWCIFNAEQKEDVLFPCDPKPLVTISQDLVDFWHNIKVQN